MPRKGYRKPADEARSIPVKVCLTPQEKSHLLKCVEASEVHGMADFIRKVVMGFAIKPRRPHTYDKLVNELAVLNRRLASIDNNMNQFAKTANMGLIISEHHFTQELAEHRDVKAQARAILEQVAMRQ